MIAAASDGNTSRSERPTATTSGKRRAAAPLGMWLLRKHLPASIVGTQLFIDARVALRRASLSLSCPVRRSTSSCSQRARWLACSARRRFTSASMVMLER
ncbi:MAG: hypothetical protein H6730_18100 [Deltaproteobacteria bacterium]|nr:hypothetical protein [Deltaproteobacteria bacterium]